MSFSQNVITGSSADGEYVYYNATIINNTVRTTQSTDNPQVYFQDTRQFPLLKDVGKYVVSVDSFSLNGATKSLPVLIPQIQPQTLGTNTLTSAVANTTTSGSPATLVTYTLTSTPSSQTTWTRLQPGQNVTITGYTGASVAYNTTAQVVSSTATTFTIVNPSSAILSGASASSGTGNASFQDPTDVTTTIYTVTFGLTTNQGGTARYFSATIPVTWINENQASFTDIPRTALPTQSESNYYYCYNYSHFVDLLNNALNTAWESVMYKVNAVISNYGGTRCPFFEYNPATGLFSLCQDSLTSWLPYGTVAITSGQAAYSQANGIVDPFQPLGQAFGASTTTTGVTSFGTGTYGTSEFSFVGMNSNLEGLLTNFDTYYYGGNNTLATVSSGAAVSAGPTTTTVGNTANAYAYTQNGARAILPNAVTWVQGTTSPVYFPENIVYVSPSYSGVGNIFTLPQPWGVSSAPTIYYIRSTQDFISTGSLWSPCSSFVLTTSQIPVRFEGNAAPQTLGSDNLGGESGVSGASQKVLLETPIDAVTADLWRGFVLYKPLVPLFSALDPSHDGLTNLDIRLMWRNRLTNSLVPVKLYNGGTVSFRLRFVRK